MVFLDFFKLKSVIVSNGIGTPDKLYPQISFLKIKESQCYAYTFSISLMKDVNIEKV